jgi:carboxyl-terminal processing protease
VSVNGRRITTLLVSVTVLGATFALGSWFGAARVRDRDEWADGRLLSTAIDSVRANALDSLPSEELIRRAMSGMLRELHDPYAALLRPDGYKHYKGSLHGEGDGMGLAMRSVAGAVSVTRVAEGSPAAAAGVRAGDRVLSVNSVPISEGWGRRAQDTSTTPIDTAHIVLWRIRRGALAERRDDDAGADDGRGADTSSVRRIRGDSVVVRLHRGTWHVPAVTDALMLADSVAYVRVASITTKSAEELERAVAGLQAKGARSLLLDLRGNAGGLFDEGVDAAGLFLPRNTVVASLAGRNGARPELHRGKRSRFLTLPLTVLVDAGTASAAEVIAAALRDHARALLVGAPTYGKGVVQRVVRLTPDLALRLTTARWLTPRGVSLERRQGVGAAAHGGLTPDVLLDDASRFDAFALPREWPLARTVALSAMADSLATGALQDGWSVAPVAMLEARLRQRAAIIPAQAALADLLRDERVGLMTRLATVRVLELQGEQAAMLRYSARSDAAIRAGLDLLAPGVEVSHVTPSVLPPPRAIASRPSSGRAVATRSDASTRTPALRAP